MRLTIDRIIRIAGCTPFHIKGEIPNREKLVYCQYEFDELAFKDVSEASEHEHSK